jgi:hypothetical protein
MYFISAAVIIIIININIKNYIPTPQKTRSPTQMYDGYVCGEIITIYSGKHTKHINVFCEQNV